MRQRHNPSPFDRNESNLYENPRKTTSHRTRQTAQCQHQTIRNLHHNQIRLFPIAHQMARHIALPNRRQKRIIGHIHLPLRSRRQNLNRKIKPKLCKRMIDLFNLKYPSYIDKNRFRSILMLEDGRTTTYFLKNDDGTIGFRDSSANQWWYCQNKMTITHGTDEITLKRGQSLTFDNGCTTKLTQTKEEILQKAIEYFMPLAINISPQLTNTTIFLN